MSRQNFRQLSSRFPSVPMDSIAAILSTCPATRVLSVWRHAPCLLFSDVSRVSILATYMPRVSSLATRPVSPVSPARVKQSNGERSARGRVLLSSQSRMIVQVQHYEHWTTRCEYFISTGLITWYNWLASSPHIGVIMLTAQWHKVREEEEKIPDDV